MPSLRVLVQGKQVATMSSMEEGVMSAGVSGTRVQPDFAHLDVHGSSNPDGRPSTYLIWVAAVPLSPGETVEVALIPELGNSHPGKSIEELYPNGDEPEQHSEQSWATVIEELRQSPHLHARFAFELETSNGTRFVGEAPADAHGFGFSVLWNWLRPERASVSLHTYTIASLESRGQMDDLVREYIYVGGSAKLKLVA